MEQDIAAVLAKTACELTGKRDSFLYRERGHRRWCDYFFSLSSVYIRTASISAPEPKGAQLSDIALATWFIK